jgi:hypothetical protein
MLSIDVQFVIVFDITMFQEARGHYQLIVGTEFVAERFHHLEKIG